MLPLFFLVVALAVVSAHSGNEIIVGGKSGWSTGVQYETINALAGDRLVFNFMQFHDVYQMSGDNCNFEASSAQLLAGPTASPYTYYLTQTGTFYFACSITGHCPRGQKLKVVVSEDVHSTENGTPSPDEEAAPALSAAANTKLLPPRMLHMFEKSENSVTLIWMAPENGTCDTKHTYQVSFKKGNKKSKKKWTSLKVKFSDPTAVVQNLLPNTLYTFQVLAMNGVGEASKPALFSVKTGPPVNQ